MDFQLLPNAQQLMQQPAVFMGLLFAAVTVLSYAIFGLLVRRYDSPLKHRLRGPRGIEDLETVARARPPRSLPPLVERLSRAAGKPIMPREREEQGRLRRKLGYAGLYSASAIHVFAGMKIIFMGIGVVGGAMLGLWAENVVLAALLASMFGILGLMLPSVWLSHRISARQRMLQASLPDALDLMVVCVEAGLTIDAALQRVGEEIALAHPEISRELAMTHMETRIGVARTDALRNLGHRTGSAALQSLAAMLVQAERFGTSIGTALRVHADSLRVKRQHEAEERAAKTTVKLAFPVVLFIFPTVIVVLGGPAFILFFKSPLFSN